MKHAVPGALDGARADRVVALLFALPRGAARRLIDDKRVRVDDRAVKKGDCLRAGAWVRVVGDGAWLLPDASVDVVVLFANDDLVIVDKPRGVPCHPLLPSEGGTLVDAVCARYPDTALAAPDPRDGGLVHRLDNDTSGAVAIARHRAAHVQMRAQFAAGAVDKRDLALVQGCLRTPVLVDGALAHDPADARRMVLDADGTSATTHAVPLAVGASHTLVLVHADRGRRHQVRVHLASAGHALVGDTVYGAIALAPPTPSGHWLHALQLELPGVPRVWCAPPAAFVALAAQLGCPVDLKALRAHAIHGHRTG